MKRLTTLLGLALALSASAAVPTIPAEGAWYRIKSHEGNYVSTTGSSIALSSSSAYVNEKKFFIAPYDTETYTIQDCNDLYITRNTGDTWSISLTDSTDDANRTVKLVESSDEDYINIQFTWNSKHLGVDNDADGAGIYCDKGGDDRTLSMWQLVECPAPSSVPEIPAEGAWYRIKSYEGNYIATTGSSISLSTDDATANAQKWYVTPTDDDCYTIQDYNELYLTRGSNSWSIALGNEASAAMTVKLAEALQSEYVTVQFTWNSNYLGVDNDTDAAGIYCDKGLTESDGSDRTRSFWQFEATDEPVEEIIEVIEYVYGDENYLYNGDFEAEGYEQAIPSDYTWSPNNTWYQLTTLPGWSISDSGVWNGVASLVTDGDNHYVTLRGNKDNGWANIQLTSDAINGLEAGETYALFFDVNHPNALKPYNAQVLDSNSTVITQWGETLLATDGWETKSVIFTAPEDGVVSVKIYMPNSADSQSNKYVSFDNVIVCTATVVEEEQPIVVNGDFEDAGYAQSYDSWSNKLSSLPGWSFLTNDTWGGIVRLDTEDNGNQYITCSTYAWNAWWMSIGVSQDVNLTVGTEYSISYLVNKTDGGCWYGVRLTDANGDSLYSNGEIYATTDGWEEFSDTFIATTATATLKLYEQQWDSHTGANYAVSFDDVVIEPYVEENSESGIATVAIDDTDAPVIYYNLMGMRVSNPTRGQVYIMTRGSKSVKVVF